MENRGKRRIRRKHAGYKRLAFWFVLLVLVLIILFKLILPASVTFSRYVYKVVRNFYFNSRSFYFNSDKLSEDGSAVFEADNWSGADAYTVTINMNSRKNIIEVAKDNINYSIDATCKLYHADGTEYPVGTVDFTIAETNVGTNTSATGITRTIFANTNTSSFDFSVGLRSTSQIQNGDYVFVEITAQSTSPYEKTLSGTFKIIVGKQGMAYQIEDSSYSPYANLIITNTRNYYTVDTAFNGKAVGDMIEIAEYLNLSDIDKAKCHSMQIELNFSPTILLLDMTNADYFDPLKTQMGYTQITDSGGNTNNFVNYLKFNMEAEESRVIKFFKQDASQDYTYPSGTSTSQVTVTAD